jgi:hypothetical protein
MTEAQKQVVCVYVCVEGWSAACCNNAGSVSISLNVSKYLQWQVTVTFHTPLCESWIHWRRICSVWRRASDDPMTYQSVICNNNRKNMFTVFHLLYINNRTPRWNCQKACYVLGRPWVRILTRRLCWFKFNLNNFLRGNFLQFNRSWPHPSIIFYNSRLHSSCIRTLHVLLKHQRTPCSWALPEKLPVVLIFKYLSALCITPKFTIVFTRGTYPSQINPIHNIHFDIIYITPVSLLRPSHHYPTSFHILLVSTTFPAHLILIESTILIILGEGYKSRSSLLHIFLQSPITSSPFGPNILLSILFSNTLSLCLYFYVRDQVPCPVQNQRKNYSLVSSDLYVFR